MKTLIWKDTSTPKFIATLFTIAKTWKQPKCPLTGEWKKMNEWMTDEWKVCVCVCVCLYIYIYIYREREREREGVYILLLSHKKNKIMSFAAMWMDLVIILVKLSQRKTNIIWYNLYVEFARMVEINLFTKQKQTDRQTQKMNLTVAKLGWTDTHYEIDKQHGSTVQCRKLYSISYKNL